MALPPDSKNIHAARSQLQTDWKIILTNDAKSPSLQMGDLKRFEEDVTLKKL